MAEADADADGPASLAEIAQGAGRRHRRTTWADKLIFPALVLVFAAAAFHAAKLIRADFAAMEARALVRSWADGSTRWTVRQWQLAHDDTLSALRITPDNPALHDQMAVIFLIRARDAWPSKAMQQLLYTEAARWQRSSLALRPGHGWTWAALAESLNALCPGSEEAWHAWRQAQRFTPHEMTVEPNLYRIGFAQWKTAPSDVKAWMRATYEQAALAQRRRIDDIAAQFEVGEWQPAGG
ncbi:hypothetical protein ISF6_1408 [Piscinibacter sakaiensis]|uniref:Transmembrane protein n=1 Tax=Piscinibacter sakaiensis TaxID=1547922 RepID=A0A0K8P0D8_PISS1|nr:hypothetical protein ISF6_1408 [Piscinibacter sakaiensis]